MKDTVDIAEGYDATNRGRILKEQRRGLTELPISQDGTR
jgi:hypothetical protein